MSQRRPRRFVARVAAFALAAVLPLGVGLPSAGAAPTTASAPTAGLDLGTGFVTLPSAASRWVAAHPTDPRTARIKANITPYPAALWLTGPESYTGLTEAVRSARAAGGTLGLALYDIPGRNDGISPPSTVTYGQYKTFVNRALRRSRGRHGSRTRVLLSAVSVDRDGAPGYPATTPWAEWIDRHMRCVVEGRHGRCQLVHGHDQPHAVVLLIAADKRAWRWRDGGDATGWLDDGGPWGNVATDRAPWIPGWP